ncbi:ZZ-type zinc finger-containing protein 3 [Phyllobates terribilis]|uniref:ZZ-type zinc finger-containing protein 3 n=1 Tax=Phyllobates terribilis TaxID=111132 RepID=UPI003CCB1444
MAASRSTRVTRSTVGFNGLDESFCGRTLRNRSIAHSDDEVPPALLRSRSPKKRPEPAPIQKGSLFKGGDLKPSAPRESWVSPRKRGLSLSEKDNNQKDSVENSDKKSSRPLSPVLKKIRRYLRSEEAGSEEEEEELSPERRNSESDHEAETPRPKRTHRCLLLDDSNQREIKSGSEPDVRKAPPDGDVFNHQAVNGIVNETAAVNCNNRPSGGRQNNTGAFPPPKELIVSENGSSLTPCPVLSKKDVFPDHTVPCTHSEERADRPDHQTLHNCLTQTNEAAAGGPCTEPLSTGRDLEEELDVVGDSVTKDHKPPSPAQETPAESPSDLPGFDPPGSDPLSSSEICFSDTQEHRYTLRTSPRKLASVKDSPSLYGENGQAEEAETAGLGAVNGSGVDPEEVGRGDQKQSCAVKCSQDKPPCSSSGAECASPSTKDSGSVQPAEEEDEEPDVYFFESDHVALKHNKDYQRLLQTISVLEAQRSQAVLDMERLSQHQRDALTDPVGFVEKLQEKVLSAAPPPPTLPTWKCWCFRGYTRGQNCWSPSFNERVASSKRQHVLNKHLFKPSTFMTSHEPPVFMEEDDDHSSFHNLDAADDEDISDEESIPASYRGLAEYKELLDLKRLKKRQLQELEAESGFVQHLGFKCDNCGIEPIQGIRWHCQDCPLQMAVDFCDSCSDCLYETQTHKEDHQLEPVYKAETFLDRDYCMPHSTSYNYLDPNYYPANR